jgi:hypothetical protein
MHTEMFSKMENLSCIKLRGLSSSLGKVINALTANRAILTKLKRIAIDDMIESLLVDKTLNKEAILSYRLLGYDLYGCLSAFATAFSSQITELSIIILVNVHTNISYVSDFVDLKSLSLDLVTKTDTDAMLDRLFNCELQHLVVLNISIGPVFYNFFKFLNKLIPQFKNLHHLKVTIAGVEMLGPH